MRVIKLSPNDVEMQTRENVDLYFQTLLKERIPAGQFFLTKGRISKNGIKPGESLVFTYLGEIVYLARSASTRMETEGSHAYQYPYYFCIDVDSINSAHGKLSALEDALRLGGLIDRNLVKSQGWPIVKETDISINKINVILKQLTVNK
jgi:hypothetical protein